MNVATKCWHQISAKQIDINKYLILQDGLPGPAEGAGDNSFMMMAMMWVVLAMVMFLLRPTSFRTSPDTKPRGNSNDDHDHNGPNGGGPRGPEPPSISQFIVEYDYELWIYDIQPTVITLMRNQLPKFKLDDRLYSQYNIFMNISIVDESQNSKKYVS